MKGNISLGNFIEQVKQELVEAQNNSDNPFYELNGVELEVAFTLEAKGSAKGKLVVVELGGETSSSQVHKVRLNLTPIKNYPIIGGEYGGGGGYWSRKGLPGGSGPVFSPPYKSINK